MRPIPIYTVDAFTDTIFKGNTCAVCMFETWPRDDVLLSIAKQNNFAETAFIIDHEDKPELRWFTVSGEVDFCGYGTLSSAYVYLEHIQSDKAKNTVTFQTRHYGEITVTETNDIYALTVSEKPVNPNTFFDNNVYMALGSAKPLAMYKTEREEILIEYKDEKEVLNIKPNFGALIENDYYGFIISAPGEGCDYTYRYFSPRMIGTWEDPVNGASQSALVPFWSHKLGKTKLHGKAVSKRGGNLFCEYSQKDRTVKIGGHVTLYQKGSIYIPNL